MKKIKDMSLEELRIEVEQLRGFMIQLADGDPCHYDHHGYCQAHSLHPKPCPMGEINARVYEKQEKNDED